MLWVEKCAFNSLLFFHDLTNTSWKVDKKLRLWYFWLLLGIVIYRVIFVCDIDEKIVEIYSKVEKCIRLIADVNNCKVRHFVNNFFFWVTHCEWWFIFFIPTSIWIIRDLLIIFGNFGFNYLIKMVSHSLLFYLLLLFVLTKFYDSSTYHLIKHNNCII